MPLRRAMLKYLAPITESQEFRALYPVFVVSVGALAVAKAERFRAVVLVLALVTIVSSLIVVYAWDAKKISLECRWNVLFFSYYRPVLARLTRSIAPHIDQKQRLDVSTFRTHDLWTALGNAGPDFEQVSGSPVVNIMSFDIEYLPLLKDGVRIAGVDYKLIPLSNFWRGRGLLEFQDRIPERVRPELLNRLERSRLLGLPIGWGLVGVLVSGSTLEKAEVIRLVTEGEAEPRGFSFAKFLESLDGIRSRGFFIYCYDFWSAMIQLLALHYTGHMTPDDEERPTIVRAVEKLAAGLKREEIISDPVVLLSKVKESGKCVVIGGASWFGTDGDLLPVSTPGAEPSYGAFCECVGLLAAPDDPTRAWMDDAVGIFSWLAENLATGSRKVADYSSIIYNYEPGLQADQVLRSHDRSSPLRTQRMHIAESARIIFASFRRAEGIQPPAFEISGIGRFMERLQVMPR